MSAAVIRVFKRDTNELVREIPVANADMLARVEMGMSINFDWENYYFESGVAA